MRLTSRAVLLLFLTAFVERADAQGSATPTSIARTFELRARAGFDNQLDDGYRRHLDWHRGAGERWAWYLWEVANGDRAGLYVDGTFGHAWADFDAPVDPAGDGANNNLNVEPFAVRFANHVWRSRPDLSGGAVDPEKAPLVFRSEYRVRAGGEAAFESAIARLRAIASAPYTVFELVSGGELPTYVVWMPAESWAQAGALADRVAAVTRGLSASAEMSRAELWRLRRDLSLCRAAASGCYATLR